MKTSRTLILIALLTGDSSTPPPPRGWTRARALRLQSAPRRWGGRRGRGTRGSEPRPSWAARATCTTTTPGADTPSRGPSLLSRYYADIVIDILLRRGNKWNKTWNFLGLSFNSDTHNRNRPWFKIQFHILLRIFSMLFGTFVSVYLICTLYLFICVQCAASCVLTAEVFDS